MGLQRNVFKALDALLTAVGNGVPVSMENIEKGTFAATGGFGGGTMTLQVSVDGTNWVSSGLTLAAAGKVDLTIPCKQARWNLAGGAGPYTVTTACSLRSLEGQ